MNYSSSDDEIEDIRRATEDEHNGQPSNLIGAIIMGDLPQVQTALNVISFETLTAYFATTEEAPVMFCKQDDTESYFNGLKHGINHSDAVVRHLAMFCRQSPFEVNDDETAVSETRSEEDSESGSEEESGSGSDRSCIEANEEEDDNLSSTEVHKKMLDMVLMNYKENNAPLPSEVLLFNQKAFGEQGRWFLEKAWRHNIGHRSNYETQETYWADDVPCELLVSVLDTLVTDEGSSGGNFSKTNYGIVKSICTFGYEDNENEKPWMVVIDYAIGNQQTNLLIYALREGNFLFSKYKETKKTLDMVLKKYKKHNAPFPNELFLYIYQVYGEYGWRSLKMIWRYKTGRHSNFKTKETDWKEGSPCELLEDVLDTMVTDEEYSDEDFNEKHCGIVKFICTRGNKDNKLTEPWEVVANYAICNQQTYMLRYALCEGGLLSTKNKETLKALLEPALRMENEFAVSGIILSIFLDQKRSFTDSMRFMGELAK